MSDNRAVARLFAKLFIARQDVKAIQAATGAYYTHVGDRNANPPSYVPWSMEALLSHIAGTSTFGHYLLSKDNTCKVFAFDLDLVAQPMALPTFPMPNPASPEPMDELVHQWEETWAERSPREAWLNRADPARDFLKTAMRDLAHIIKREIDDMDIPTTVSYTGAKGVHVYGFLTKDTPASVARDAIEAVLHELPMKVLNGKNFYGWDNSDPRHISETRHLFSIETFPKQAELSSSDGFGNLMRLPLGRNLKSKDPTFFVNMDKPMGDLSPIDAQQELERIDKELYA